MRRYEKIQKSFYIGAKNIVPKNYDTEVVFMQNNTIELVSGAYTNALWETLEDVLTNEDSPTHL